jgi:hypothetical protein
MNTEEIQILIETAIADKASVLIISNIFTAIIALTGAYLISYLTTKGKNKAMKSDIEILTNKIEEVKIRFVKEIEIFKGNQELISSKKKELYSKIEKLKLLMIEAKNDTSFNRFEIFLNETREILKLIGSNAIFKDFRKESQLIEDDYNSWIKKINDTRSKNESKFSFNFDVTFNTLDILQEKLMH